MPVTAIDLATAKRLFAEWYENDPHVSRQWIALHRERSIQALAVAEMQKRQARERGFSSARKAAA